MRREITFALATLLLAAGCFEAEGNGTGPDLDVTAGTEEDKGTTDEAGETALLDVPGETSPSCGVASLAGRLPACKPEAHGSQECVLVFDAFEVEAHSRQVAGARDDGCIGAVDLTLRGEGGCELRLKAAGRAEMEFEEALAVTDLVLIVGADCASRLGVPAGEYIPESLKASEFMVKVGPKKLSDASATCVDVTIQTMLVGLLRMTGGTAIVQLDTGAFGKGPSITGPVPFDLDEALECPWTCSCDGRQCGDDGCGGTIGTVVVRGSTNLVGRSPQPIRGLAPRLPRLAGAWVGLTGRG